MSVVPGMGKPITVLAGADISLLQFQLVKLDSAGAAVPITAITDIPFGVLQNSPVSGEPASVIPIGSGSSKLQLGATLAAGVLVSPGATGKAAAAVATAYTVGILLEGGALDELGVVYLMPLGIKA